jgi:hypothetical protein
MAALALLISETLSALDDLRRAPFAARAIRTLQDLSS